jgi:hypothetical protein
MLINRSGNASGKTCRSCSSLWNTSPPNHRQLLPRKISTFGGIIKTGITRLDQSVDLTGSDPLLTAAEAKKG